MKTRITLLAVVSMFLFLWMGGSAFAVYPHGGFATSPDACAACHRMHTATSLNLIKDPSGGGICKTCHQNGAGADTDVMNGAYITNADSVPHHAVWGVNGDKLLGGGFNYIQNTGTATSKHRVDETLVPPGSSTGASIAFKCTSCHTAHPDRDHPDQYRLLRVRPNGVASDIDVAWNGPWDDAGATTPAAVKSDLTKNRAYTEIEYGAGIGTLPNQGGPPIEYTRNYADAAGTNNTTLAEWCAACHTHYMATWTPGTPGTPSAYKSGDVYNAGDTYGNVARERHSVNTPIVNRAAINGITYNLKTDVPLADLTADGRTNDDLLTCLSCHKAHGSDATMSGNAILENRGAVLPTGTDSMLLRGDLGRRICADCHNF